jgi:hypothetical protein
MQITGVITRLNDECPAISNRVFGAAALAVADPESIVTPCAFVVPISEQAQANNTFGGHSQAITATFGIVICVTNFNDTAGEAANEELELVRQEIRIALCAWQPDWAALPIDFNSGRIVDYDDLTLRWNDIFSTQFYYRV